MRKLLLSLMLITPVWSHAQFLVQGDEPYFSESTSDVQYIFTQNNADTIPELRGYMEYFMKKYTQSYGWKLDEVIRLVVASNRNQIANGFATPTPLLETVHFTAGAEILDSFAMDSFMLVLASHETAHLYQLSVKSRMSSFLKKVFGNAPVIVAVLPFWVFPNAFLPRFIVEGNAVLNESNMEKGGRLWSGEVRAEVLAQLKAKKVLPKNLINFRLEFPYGGEAYHQGGYFQAYLTERFGLEKTNLFFKTHAQRDIWPFALNKSFRQHFGISYSRLIYDYTQKMENLANAHRPAEGQRLEQTVASPKFNHDASSIFFVSNRDGHEPNTLFTLDKSTGKLALKTAHLKLGKVFHLDGDTYSVGSDWVSAFDLKFGLLNESLARRKGSNGKIYQDIRGGHELAIDGQSYVKNPLLKNGQFVDYTASSAILDDQGQPYYFRQVGLERVLYRNREPLFKYKGFYGIPMEVDESGAILFIASTPYGASAFQWRNGQIERLNAADNIVEARKINSKTLLVAAVTDKGFDIRAVPIEPKAEIPAYFDWKFETEKIPAMINTDKRDTHEEFGGLSEMHFSQLAVQAGGNASVTAVFTDPMMWNTAIAQYEYGLGPDHAAQVFYRNSRHKVGWDIGGGYKSDAIKSPKKPSKRRDSGIAAIHLDYELWRGRRWSSGLALGPRWANDSFLPDDRQQVYGAEFKWQTAYVRNDFAYNYQPQMMFALDYEHRTDWLTTTSRKADSLNAGEILLSGDVFKETYLTAYGAWAGAEINSIRVNYLKAPQSNAAQLSIPFLISDGEAKEVREWEVSLKQAFNYSYYFPRFPYSLMRFAPLISFRDVWTKENHTNNLPKWRQQISVGSEFDLLFFHSIPMRAEVLFSSINIGGKLDTGVRFGLNVKSF